MFRSIVAGAVMALGLAGIGAGAAAAEPFDDYISMCLDHDADPGAAAAAAEAAGWFKMPANAFGEAGDPTMGEASIYTSLDPSSLDGKAFPQDLRMLMTATGEEGFGVKGVRFDVCAVGAFSDVFDYGGARDQMAGWFGFEPATLEGEEVWAFSRQGSQMRSEAALVEAEGLEQAPRGRKIYVAGVTAEGGSVLFILGALRPRT